MDQYYSGKIFLRPFKRSDFKILYEIRNDPVIQTLLLTHHRPNSRHRVWKWIRGKNRDRGTVFLIIADETDHALGFIQAKSIDNINRTCLAGVAIHNNYQSIGIFEAAFPQFEKFLKHKFKIRKIVVEIMRENSRSVKAFTKVGFNEVGILHQHYCHDGIFSDVLLMEKLLVLDE